MPLVSVILPVYNAERFIRESVDSILSQTYGDFELIIINDGSTDNSLSVLESIRDPRIVLISQQNKGLAATLNYGLTLAKGEFIARQDNDDLSLPSRFEKQLAFLQSNPAVDVVGTWAEIMDETGKATGKFHRHPTDSLQLKFRLLFDNPFVHSSVMFRKSIVTKAGNYDTDRSIFEDYNLWSRIARISQVANIPEVLLRYREVNSGMSKSALDYDARVRKQSAANIHFYCPDVPLHEIEVMLDPAKYLSLGDNESLKKFREMMRRLRDGFCSREKIETAAINELIEARMVEFRRQLYNSVIYSSSATALQKFKASVGRKVLFMTHKKYLGNQ